MLEPKKSEDKKCKKCDSEINFICSNSPCELDGWGWAAYCRNPSCDNHKARGFFQDYPGFVV